MVLGRERRRKGMFKQIEKLPGARDCGTGRQFFVMSELIPSPERVGPNHGLAPLFPFTKKYGTIIP